LSSLKRTGLQSRIIALSVLSTLVMLAVFGISSVLAVRESIDRTLNERLVLAQTAADLTDRVLKQNFQYLQDVAMNPDIDLNSSDLEPTTRALRDVYFRSIFNDGVYILDRAGNVRWSEPVRLDSAASNRYSFPHVREALESGRPVTSNVYTTVEGHRPVVSLVYPILNSAHQVVGLVGGDIDITNPSLASITQPVRLGKTGYSQIVDGNGIVLASGRQQDILSESDHKSFLAGLIQEKRTSMGTCHDCHDAPAQRETEVMAFAPLASTNWGITIRQSQEEALAPTEQLKQQFTVFSVAMTLLSLLLAWAIAQSVVRPVSMLTAAAERIAGGNLTESIPVTGEDEIGTLAMAFDGMRVRLKGSVDKIQQWNRELESNVQLRTRELKESQQQLVQRNRELSLLNAISSAVSQSLNLDTILESALDQVVDFMRADAAILTIFEVNPERNGEKTVYRGLSPEVVAAAARMGSCKHQSDGRQPSNEPADPCLLRDAFREAYPNRSENGPIACVKLNSKGMALGTLCVARKGAEEFDEADSALLASVAHQIAVAVENATLYQELERKEAARGELLRKVISAQEEERKRIARELHDETSQALAALGVALETVSVAPAKDAEEVKARVAAIKPLAVRMLEEVRKLTLDLRPTVLDDLGLIPAIRWYAENRLKPQGIKVQLETAGIESRLPQELETTLFRVVQEAITNIARHSEAENVVITLDLSKTSVVIEVEDDGKGFDLNAVSRNVEKGQGLGLMGMRERVALFSGILSIDTTPASGTQLRIEVPLGGSTNGQD
jgi:signal transduction histidine kinase